MKDSKKCICKYHEEEILGYHKTCQINCWGCHPEYGDESPIHSVDSKQDSLKKELDWKIEFDKKFQHFGECKRNDVIAFIKTLLEEQKKEIAEDICKLIDKLELGEKDTSMEEWKMFKHIRNAIRDKYFKV